MGNDGQQSIVYKRAIKKARKIKKFYKHLVFFLVVNCFIMAFDLIFVEGLVWFYWITLVWAFPLVAHLMMAYDIELFGKNWEKKKIQELVEREKERQEERRNY